ncbi:MAG: hypothetical protein ABI619_08510, partial [Betaproteobacteria bacterium]
MPRVAKSALTPFPRGRCWKKYRTGKVYYVGKGQAKPDGTSPWDHGKYTGNSTDCPFYKTALLEWIAVSRKLAADESAGLDTSSPEYQQSLKRWRRQLVQLSRSANTIATLELNDLLRAAQLGENPQLNFAYLAPPASAVPRKPLTTGTDIAGLVSAYLENQRAKVPSQFSVKHYQEMHHKLTYFLEYAEAQKLTDVSAIDAAGLQHFRNEQLHWLSAPKEQGGVSRATVKKRLDCLKNWLLWCEEIGVYSTPGYLLKLSKVKSPRIDPETIGNNGNSNPTFSVAEIQELWGLATERMRLFLLLGLNCGFTQIDISTLHRNHFDRKTNVIDRLRNKTKHHIHPTRQVFNLWPETNALLLKNANTSSELILRTESGNELLTRRINDDGSVTEIDSIRLAFDRLRTQWFKQQIFSEHPELAERCSSTAETEQKNDRLSMLLRKKRRADNRGFKVLRKSAANELEHKAEYKDLVSLFLAHSETATKKFYTNPDYKVRLSSEELMK